MLKKIKSDFSKNLIILLIGASLSQLIPILASIILTRMYTPEDFGIFALFTTITIIISSISTGRYELAIMLPKKNIDALYIFVVSIMIVILVSFILFVIVIFFGENILNLFERIDLFIFLYLIPIMVLIMGFYQSILLLLNRNKSYKNISQSKIVHQLFMALFQIILGLLGFINSLSLVIGSFFGQLFAVILLMKNNIFNFKYIKKLNKERLKLNISRYSNFPKYSMPMAFLNSLSVNIFIYILPVLFNTSLLGFYFLAQKFVSAPLSLIVNSFGSVFYQEISNRENKLDLYLISFFSNLLLGSLILSPIFFYGQEIFAYIFGEEWSEAGNIAEIICPLVLSSFAVGSVSNIFSAIQKNEIVFYWQLIYLIIFSILIYYLQYDFIFMLEVTTYFGSIMYFILAIIGYKLLIKMDR